MIDLARAIDKARMKSRKKALDQRQKEYDRKRREEIERERLAPPMMGLSNNDGW